MDCKINCIAETYYPSSAEIFPDSCQARQCNSWGLSTSSAFTNEDVSDQALNLLQWDSEKMETPDQCFCLLSCQGTVFPQAEQSIPSSVPRCSLPVAAAAHWVAAFAKTYCKPNSGEARVPSLVTQRNLNTQTETKSKMKKKAISDLIILTHGVNQSLFEQHPELLIYILKSNIYIVLVKIFC